MAGNDLTFSIASDTTDFDRGIRKGVIEPLEDAQEALDDLGNSRSLDELEDAMRDAQRDTERFEDSIKDVRDALGKAGRAGKDIGDDVKSGTDRAKRGIDDMRDEAADTGREMAASFKEPADALDAVQELAANALSGLGPAGVVAGGAAAVGIGVVTSVLQEQQEEADRLKEKMAGMYQEAVESGREYLDEAQIIKAVNDIMFDPENADIYKQAKSDAETLGVTLNDVLLAQAGDQESINKLIEAGTQKAEAMRDTQLGTRDANVLTAEALGNAITRYEDLNKLGEDNRARAERSLELERQLGERESANQAAAREAIAEKGRKLDEYYARAANPPNPVITPTVNTAEADRRLRELTSRRYEIEIGVRYPNGKPVLQ